MGKFVDENSEVYKQRQAKQLLQDQYFKRALAIYADTNVHITPTSTPVTHENGAFIDAVVFIPKGEIE